MLGIKEIKESVKAPFAEQMIESLKRANTGNLNEEENANLSREDALNSLFSSVWA